MITSLKQIWRLAVICAWRPGGRLGILIFAAVFGLGLVGIHITVRLIRWTNDFYNALQRLDVQAAVHQIGVFFVLVAISAALHLAANYLRKLLQIRWRRVLTDAALEVWLAGHAYWHMRDRTEHGLDNPDQRIADDCRIYVFRLTTEALEFITAIVALFTYVSILWSLSTFPLAFTLFGFDVSIPRYMVWAAPLYVAVSSGVTHWLGAPLVPLNFEQQKTEADFRFALARFRQSGEQVALLSGEKAERRLFDRRFSAIVGNWHRLMNRELILGCFTRPYMQTVLRIPLFLALPAFLAGRVTFGGLMQIGSAFQNVVTTMSWFIFSYRDLAELAAAAKRLDSFLESAGSAAGTPSGVSRNPEGGDTFRLSDVVLKSPAGRDILDVDGLDIRRGEAVWLRGPSGRGKTTLVRMLAGLWPDSAGHVDHPDGRMLFLPQQAYLPIGSLKDAAVYPADAADIDDREVIAALGVVGLGRLAESAHLAADVTSLGLSGGERQRLVLARLLFEKPDWALLDEATGALDEPAETRLFSALRETLPTTTFILIAHRRPTGLGDVREVELGGVARAPVPA
ncbi:MAG: ABC transporter ATP-binding protein/permease [Phreatobacter sp.]|uniref:ABC transporter ATP-binding protein/permease n=1 Tax=Phreatobacter sp. TaxID=1966341 RepID=UPI001A4E6724|nr:ABC transporter ATP-binding protein/permease [Phreatobacter sp.]MBL8568242.1 ABC transporter ATP-binding protein/permease [Phreatobacter sp.]